MSRPAAASSVQEKRAHQRTEVDMYVELKHDEGTIQVRTYDLSHGGVFLQKGDYTFPSAGAEVTLKVVTGGDHEAAQPVRAKVVRVTAEGIGLQFIE